MEGTIIIQDPKLAENQFAKNQVIEETVKKEQKKLFNFIRRRVNSETEAEDILQDVFYQFAANYDLVEPIQRISSWLFTVARNRITDFYRKKKPINVSDLNLGGNDDEENPGNHILDSLFTDYQSSDAETQFLNSMIWDALQQALNELPAVQKEVFVMHELEDRSFNEISEMTGLTVNTLLSRKRYAVLHLRKRLKTLYLELLNN